MSFSPRLYICALIPLLFLVGAEEAAFTRSVGVMLFLPLNPFSIGSPSQRGQEDLSTKGSPTIWTFSPEFMENKANSPEDLVHGEWSGKGELLTISLQEPECSKTLQKWNLLDTWTVLSYPIGVDKLRKVLWWQCCLQTHKRKCLHHHTGVPFSIFYFCQED